ncbi:MAG TPA: hypothetical protein VNO81_14750, partial [Candidatus Nitrosotenuis sp.]|nr:hypothetical protein [Candidatus Nitrosotenuis sp.]
MSLRSWALLVCMLVLGLGTAQARPGGGGATPGGANPGGVRPGASQPVYTRHLYIFAGTVESFSSTSIQVSGRGSQGKTGTMTFQIPAGVSLPQGLKNGDRVVVNYNYTIEQNVYEAGKIFKLPAGAQLPQNT